MKNQITILGFLIIGAFFPFSEAKAQYSIPAYDVLIVNVDTYFEEGSKSSFYFVPTIREERQLIIKVEDNEPSETTWATVIVYSLDGFDELGPYTVYEGSPLPVTIDERDWGVRVLGCLTGCILSTWIE